ncbi:hypothetical protein RA11412_1311 [Rothia aeria]|uniref:Uncharacterized protein n=1 Tax=Rothia aeria TaxID=172042 RepID=A0A2Z5QZA1_9MICC|nr:hypothetical protein RA11412_1311 [Rothia aeria]
MGATDNALHTGFFDTFTGESLLLPSGTTRTWHQFTVLPLECVSGSIEST